MASTLDLGLRGRICVVTGAGSGIGRAVALAFAGHGARVAILDRDAAMAAETLALAKREGGEAIAVPCDVADEASVESARASVTKAFGDADILVNNAAILRKGDLATLSLADWNALIAVNLTGYFLCARAFSRAMARSGEGCLIHVGSIMSNHVSPYNGAYSVAKAGVELMSRQWAIELGPQGVRSNCVRPGLVRTPLSEANYANEDFRKRREAAVPLRRIAGPEDIARAALFLASPLAAYVNGTELLVDGGFDANLMSLVPRTHNPNDVKDAAKG